MSKFDIRSFAEPAYLGSWFGVRLLIASMILFFTEFSVFVSLMVSYWLFYGLYRETRDMAVLQRLRDKFNR